MERGIAEGRFLPIEYFVRVYESTQGKVEKIFSKLLTKIYNFEFNMDSDAKDEIKVTLPPPIYLNAINSAQILDSVNTMCESMAKLHYNDNESDKQIEFARLLKLELSGNLISKDIIDKCKDQTEMNIAKMGDQQQ